MTNLTPVHRLVRDLVATASLFAREHLRQRPRASLALALATLACGFYVIVYPFTVVTYPPITDLPFHAAESSIVRHYFDPAYHFREQFELHFFEVPYASMYVLGAFFALFMSIVWATKLTAITLLAMLPVGLAVLFHGMKKSPLWGVLGLGFVWGTLTHWGFLNYVSATGLFAMVCGMTLIVVDRPSVARQVGLTLALLSVFVTHIYRYPFALAAVVGIALFMYPATRRFKPVVLPLLIAASVYASWTLVRRPGLAAEVGPIAVHPERLAEMPEYLFSSFVGNEEARAATHMLWVLGALAAVSTVLFFAQGRHRARDRQQLWWGVAITLLPLLMGGAFFLAYLALPMSIGAWWFVYPREISTAAYIVVAAMPDLPRPWWQRLPLLAAFALASGQLAFITASHWFRFDEANRDFAAIMQHIPQAPKLMYLVFDHSGSDKRVTPFIHMPAWVQAQKGGWLSFHFVALAPHPIKFRDPGPNIPPPRPLRWEWTPERFDLQSDGPFFDTFLVRRVEAPDALFAADPSIHRLAHEGRWWLYRRQPAPLPGAALAP